MMDRNEISGAIVDAAMKVHSALGPGLLESAYAACLRHELIKRGFRVQSEVPVPVLYDGIRLEAGYKLDLLVEDTVVVELKAIEALAPIHQAQIISLSETSKEANRSANKLSFTPSQGRHKAICCLMVECFPLCPLWLIDPYVRNYRMGQSRSTHAASGGR